MKTLIHNTVAIAICLVCVGCDEDQDPAPHHPLVGVWEEAVNYYTREDPQYSRTCDGDDYDFDGTWQFKEDESYRLDFVYVGMDGHPNVGYSEGTFSLESDSILILSATEVTDLSIAHEFDTLIVESITDTMFVEHDHRVLHYDSFGPCLRFWKRID